MLLSLRGAVGECPGSNVATVALVPRSHEAIGVSVSGGALSGGAVPAIAGRQRGWNFLCRQRLVGKADLRQGRRCAWRHGDSKDGMARLPQTDDPAIGFAGRDIHGRRRLVCVDKQFGSDLGPSEVDEEQHPWQARVSARTIRRNVEGELDVEGDGTSIDEHVGEVRTRNSGRIGLEIEAPVRVPAGRNAAKRAFVQQ
jgi:hypothetical protein